MVLNRQRQVAVSLPRLNLFLQQVCTEMELDESAVSVCLVSDRSIARMNRAFRGKPGPTDVLSFPSSRLRAARRSSSKNGIRSGRAARAGNNRKPPHASRLIRGFLGDIAISPETARRNARQLGRSLSSELQILILHGVLHLLGYDHEADDGTMMRVEARLRRRLRIG